MPSLVVIFPVSKEAEADAYLLFCQSNNPNEDPMDNWYPGDRVDAHGQRVVGYMGPGGGVTTISVEPVGGHEARADGVLQEGYDPPEA